MSGEVIELRTGFYNIWSETAKANISTNGIHRAVKVGDMVFDNIHKNGRPYAEWIKDFTTSAPSGVSPVPLRSF